MEDTTIFQQGDEVQRIVFPNDGWIAVGINGTESISVIIEDGQLAAAPWFAVWKNGKIVSKWNGAYIAGVIMKEE